MTEGHIKFGEHILHFYRYGHGEKAFIAFHGFGQGGEYLAPFESALGHEYTIYAFDLFFHGKSYYADVSQALEKQELGDILQAFFKQEQIDQFDVLGYSMGGKFALSCIELFPESIQTAYLIAPDGIKTSFWYSLATYPQIFRDLFHKIIKKPEIFWKITKTANSLRIVDKSILKFAKSQMKTEEQRQRVYFTWVIFRHLKFNLKDIAEIINTHKIDLKMITGAYDKIVTTENMRLLLKHLDDYEEIVLDTGHNHLIRETAEYIEGRKY